MSMEFVSERFECDTNLEEIRKNYLNPPKNEEACSHCRCYENNWTCPPFTENQTNVWYKYENIKIIIKKLNFTNEFLKKQFTEEELIEYAFDLIHSQKTLIEQEELYDLEKELNGEILTSGPCVTCKCCQRLDGKECVMPEKRKYAMESLGANAIGIAKKFFDLDLKWIKENKLPEYLVVMVAVLYN